MDQNDQITPEIRSYLEGLLKDSGMIIEDSAREGIIRELYARLDNFLASAILENIPEDQVDTFITTTGEKKSLDEMQKYLLEKMPNAQEILTKAFLDFRQLYLGNVAAKKESENIKQTN